MFQLLGIKFGIRQIPKFLKSKFENGMFQKYWPLFLEDILEFFFRTLTIWSCEKYRERIVVYKSSLKL